MRKVQVIIILMLTVLLSFTSCANNEPNDPNLNENEIKENINNDAIDDVIEDADGSVGEYDPLSEEETLHAGTESAQAVQTILPIQFMSEQEAEKITGGKLVYMPEHNFMLGSSTIYKAYLTPTGKLVYMTDFIFSQLDGASDFEVTWGYMDLNELNIRTDMGRSESGTVSVSAILSDKTAVKYDLYLDQWEGNPISGLEGVICYAKVSSGTIFFDIGLTVDNPEFSDYDVTYTFTGNPYYEPQTLCSKVGQVAYICDIYRIYPFNADVEWKINAEIKDPAGNIVYTEDLKVCESYNPLDNTFFIAKGEKIVQ